MLWRRTDLERAGGIRALGAEIAEDAAATKVVRRAGKRVRLVDRAFGQPLGNRSAGQIWSRQVRWAKLRRATFPVFFLPEVLSGSCAPLLAAVYAAEVSDVSGVGVAAALGAVWFGCEAATRARRRVAHERAVAARLGRARSDAAGAVGAGVARQLVQLARQRHAPCRRRSEQLSLLLL